MITIAKKDGALGPNVGREHARVDGRKKVTGQAPYAADHGAAELLHGVIVNAAIAVGEITRLDASRALAVPGVLHVFTHENRPPLPWFSKSYTDDDAPAGKPFRPLYDGTIRFDGQPIALVVAESLETARHAASLVSVTYRAGTPETSLRQHAGRARDPKKWAGGRKPPPKPRGDADGALASAAVRVDAEYGIPPEHHNPMELFATTVIAEPDGTFTVHDKTQGAFNSQQYACRVFDLAPEQVRIVSPFVGGAFGSALRPQHQLFFAMLAAKELRRSVRVEMTRPQMFTFGHRPTCLQRVSLGASKDGKLAAIVHEALTDVSRFEDYVETMVNWGPLLYACENVRTAHRFVELDVYTPIDMRAPGAVSGLFAFESAMDELAHALRLDPVRLRLENYAERAIDEDKDFSSKELRACYAQGAERFGWSRRNPEPRSMREGDKLVGWGMASGCWDAQQMFAAARGSLGLDGRLRLTSGTTDIGTGTYTVMTQIAADVLGLPMDHVTFDLGDTRMPKAPLQGGSWTAVTVGSAVKATCDAIAAKLFDLAREALGPDVKREDVAFEDGHVLVAADRSRRVSFVDAMRAANVLSLEAEETAVPDPRRTKYAHYSHSAVFVEVKVDETLGVVEVSRVVSAIAGGRVLSPKLARNQIMGGAVWGISMALHEESMLDHRFGRFVNHDLAGYHVPVNRDIGAIDVIFVDEHDEHVNALGAKGLGEIGIIGVAAAVANAVFHATGKRVRELPITLDKLL